MPSIGNDVTATLAPAPRNLSTMERTRPARVGAGTPCIKSFPMSVRSA